MNVHLIVSLDLFKLW